MIDAPISDLISKDLRRWFKEKWVDVSRKDKDGKHPPCGRGEAKTDSKGYPKCRPSKKVSKDTPKTSRSMSPKEKKAATRRKRSKPQGVGGKPTMVKSMDADPRDDILRRKVLEFILERMKSTHERTGDGSVWDKYVQAALMAQPYQLLQLLETMESHQNEEIRNIARSIREEYESLSEDYVNMFEGSDFTASADPFEQAIDSIIKDDSKPPPHVWRYNRHGLPIYPCKKCGKDLEGIVENFTALCWRCREGKDKTFEHQYGDTSNVDYFTASADPFEAAWDSIAKGRFHGYSRSSISDRPYRQAEHRVWDVSRKVKRERTKRRYARNKSRGTVRPAMRRQLGAGGKRASTKR